MDCSMAGSSVRGIFQARMLEWVAISYSMGSSGSRNWTCVSCNAGRFFTAEPLGKPLSYLKEEKRVLCNQARPSRKACILERIKVIVSAIVASWICLQAWPMNILWKDCCWKWNSNTLATWCEELTHMKRPWCWERLKAGGEGNDRGWDGWMASLTQWTWVWVNSGSWWWTGRPGVLQSMGLQRVRHDWATELNWLSHPWNSLCKYAFSTWVWLRL